MHIPVLQKKVLEYLNPKPNENFVDCTINGGGHTIAILDKNGPNGKVLGIDLSRELIKKLELQVTGFELQERLILVCDNFVNLKKIAEKNNFKSVQGILFDLGMSSWHLKGSGRGFSFLRNEPLDMRYKGNAKCKMQNAKSLTAKEIVNEYSQQKIEKILKEYGEENFAKTIARNIVETRKISPIKTTFQLVKIIKNSVPGWYERQRIHFATRTFQALRIAVNDELNNLERTLPQALELLESGGRMVIISFHSLEDRIVKNFLKSKAKEKVLKLLTKKPIMPNEKEVSMNPRSRSAKLRSAIKIR